MASSASFLEKRREPRPKSWVASASRVFKQPVDVEKKPGHTRSQSGDKCKSLVGDKCASLGGGRPCATSRT
jgi:hypothetical protein